MINLRDANFAINNLIKDGVLVMIMPSIFMKLAPNIWHCGYEIKRGIEGFKITVGLSHTEITQRIIINIYKFGSRLTRQIITGHRPSFAA